MPGNLSIWHEPQLRFAISGGDRNRLDVTRFLSREDTVGRNILDGKTPICSGKRTELAARAEPLHQRALDWFTSDTVADNACHRPSVTLLAQTLLTQTKRSS